MSRFHTVFSLCFLSASLFAQEFDIRGVVSDSATGERVPFASVVLSGTGRGAASNVDGFYLIASIPPGSYNIVVSAVGYLRVEKLVVVSNAHVTLDFRVSQEAVQMDEVIVRERARRELKEISTSVHVMDTRDLKLVPVTIQDDALRSIQILPGVVSSSDVSSHFYVRGGASEQNLFLLDGVRMYSPYHAFGIFSIFDSDIVNATEVYTGAFPPEYGGRLSSVVSLRSRDGNPSSFAARTSVNQLSAKIAVDGPLSETARVLVNARKSLFAGPYKDFLQQDAAISFYDLFAKITFEGSSSQTRFNVFTFQTGDRLPSGNDTDPDYLWNNSMYAARATTLFGDRLYVSTLLAYSSATASRQPPSGSPISPASTSVQEFAVRGDGTIYSKSGGLYFVGFDISFPSLSYRFDSRAGIRREVTDTSPEITGWVRFQEKWGDLQMDAGVHADAATIGASVPFISIFQPRIHLSYAFLPAWRAKASFGNHTQNVVTLTNEDDLISLFEPWSTVPDGLPKEEARHFVIGVQGNVIAEISTEIQAYAKDYTSLVAYNRNKVDEDDPDYIHGTGKAYGLEGTIRFGFHPVDVYAAYTLGWVRVKQDEFSYAPRYDRRHTLKTLTVISPWTSLDLSIRWEFGTGFPYTPTSGFYDRLTFQEYFGSGYEYETGPAYIMLGDKNSVRLPAYHRLDAGLTYRLRLGSVEASLGANVLNVYNRRNLFYFDRKTGRRINMLPFYPSVTLTVSYR